MSLNGNVTRLIAGVPRTSKGAFIEQVARNLTDVDDGFLLHKAFLIMDHDTKHTDDFTLRTAVIRGNSCGLHDQTIFMLQSIDNWASYSLM